ncbi:hypothetical protein [Paludibaculum fermentans]|uniref:Uncharacterized protein n=1 Tax=Paludibaculum fermentans TaxID=1473598 RepID=A0A7S7NMS3_PALFE|nr:hypothetical protein [Paludibaculum fermentans]QOY86493.1 hypothetical protein IRI77_27370 [Paludibaculum fermentans]
MPRSFNFDIKSHTRDPRHVVRILLGVLLVANLVAAWFVFQTPGGTLEQLDADLVAKRKQLIGRQQSLERMKKLLAKATQARDAGDSFLGAYFLPRRNAYSMLEVDLALAAHSAGIRAKERSYNYEPIEGSDTLGMLNINASFEGTYADLIELVNAIDRSKRLLIIEQLQAQPQQGTNVLGIVVKLNAFFRMDGPEATKEDLSTVVETTPVSDPMIQPKPLTPVRQTMAPPPPPQPTQQTVKPMQQPPVSEPRSGPLPTGPRQRPIRRPPSRGGLPEQDQ